MRAVGWDGSDGRDVSEEQDPVHAGVGYIGKFLELFSRFVERFMERFAEIAAELMGYAHGDFFETSGAQLGYHAAGLQRSR